LDEGWESAQTCSKNPKTRRFIRLWRVPSPIGDSNKIGTLNGSKISTSPLATYDGDLVIKAATNSNSGSYTNAMRKMTVYFAQKGRH